jgi:hypothetical protein
MRFSLLNLFVAISMAGVVFASVITGGPWVALLYTLTLLLFAVIGLRAIVLRERKRAFAIAFAVAGGLYLMMANCTSVNARSALLTNYPLALVAREFQLPAAVDRSYRPASPASGGAGGIPTAMIETVEPNLPLDLVIHRAYTGNGTNESLLARFFLIGHCVWSWLIGLAFGWAAIELYDKRNSV